MGFRFTPEIFMLDSANAKAAAASAQAALDTHLKSCPVVFGTGLDWDDTKQSFDTHRAVLFNVEKIEPKDERVTKDELINMLEITKSAFKYPPESEFSKLIARIAKHGVRE